jgi:hypothetical protein
MTAKNTPKKNDMTQREWDRIVGIGNPPAPEWKGKWTNHKATWDRYPHDKKNDNRT